MKTAAPASPAKRSHASANEHFPSIPKIKFEGPRTLNPLSFAHYNASEVVHGKTMKEWLKFSVCYWHTFRGQGSDPFGEATLHRSWEEGSSEMEIAKDRLDAAFEFMSKLGVEYYTFHDRDIAPVGKDWKETNENLDVIVSHALVHQKETGIKLLWGTQNLFSEKVFMCGAGTNPDAHVFILAAAQIKKVLEVTKKLGGDNVVFWGGREGFSTILNTNMKRELDHMAALFKMAIAYKKKIGATFQFLIEPKPREPMKHQYDYDAATVIAFLRTYGLEKDFKLNIEPNHTTLAGHDYHHDILYASKYGMLGSVDANTGDSTLGWDTDQFPSDVKQATLVMKVILEQGGLGKGGLNFDAKVRRESTSVRDLFIGHIGAMDTFALGLKIAAKWIEGKDCEIPKMIKARYSSFDSGIGAKIEKGEVSLEECEEYIHKFGMPKNIESGNQELYELLFNRLVHE